MLLLSSCDASAPAGGGGEVWPRCTPIPQPTIAPVTGLIVPPGAHIYRARPSGKKLTNVRGYVDLDPISIRKFYGSLERRKGYEFFLLEDEVIEAEAFFTDGKWRNYVRARQVCEGRSELFVLVAPEDYGDEVDIPRRSPTPSR